MNIRVNLNQKLVRRIRKIATERGTSISALVREYLERLVAENPSVKQRRAAHEALERSFKDLSFTIGKRNWKREDLYERS